MSSPSTVAIPLKPQQHLADVVREYLQDYFIQHGENLPEGQLYDMVIQQVEKPLLELVLKQCGGNQSKASVLLGVSRNTLRQKIQDLGVDDTLVASRGRRARRARIFTLPVAEARARRRA